MQNIDTTFQLAPGLSPWAKENLPEVPEPGVKPVRGSFYEVELWIHISANCLKQFAINLGRMANLVEALGRMGFQQESVRWEDGICIVAVWHQQENPLLCLGDYSKLGMPTPGDLVDADGAPWHLRIDRDFETANLTSDMLWEEF